MDNTETQKIISLCSGILGIERGLKSISKGFKTVAYVEIEAFINFNLAAAMEADLVDTAPIWSNLKTFDGSLFYNKIHGIIGGYPCQPFSNAGLKKGVEDPRHLWPYIERLIKSTNPLWCFFENVEGHLNIGFPEVYKSLRNMGYKVEAGLYTAAEVGAPHQRKRLFILAMDEHAKHSKFWQRMAYANCESGTIQQIKRSRTVAIGAFSPGAMANTYDGKHTKNGGGGTKEDKLQEINGEILRSGMLNRTDFKQSSETMANPHGEPVQRSHDGKGLNTKGRQKQNGQARQCRDTWPAKPGYKQYEWEEPRAIPKKGHVFKSGVGCTINGYNFKPDLLRALGNGVVEQTAGFAFIDLVNLHLKNK